MNFHIITILDGLKLNSEISYIYEGNLIHMIYGLGKIQISEKDEYPFFALVKIRRELEKLNGVLLCNGSRKDVYPSGMSAVGLMAYILEENKPATRLVNILEPCNNAGLIRSVEEQKKCRLKWLNSLKL